MDEVRSSFFIKISSGVVVRPILVMRLACAASRMVRAASDALSMLLLPSRLIE
jgi:hypothetical protein